MDHTLSPLYTQLTALAAKHGAQKLVLFGSRAREDHTERSDIDLAVYGMPPENRPFFWADTEELDTLLNSGKKWDDRRSAEYDCAGIL